MNRFWLWVARAIAAGCVVFGLYVANGGMAHAEPAYCYTSGTWQPFPQTQGWCPDSQPPFHGPAPSYGGGNHRWPDGGDD